MIIRITEYNYNLLINLIFLFAETHEKHKTCLECLMKLTPLTYNSCQLMIILSLFSE